MNNINPVVNWSWDTPTEEGFYAICDGDAETPDSIQFHYLRVSGGSLVDNDLMKVSAYKHRRFKFARIVFNA